MQAEPASRREPPAYPTRVELKAENGVLGEHLPKAWKTGSGFAGAVALLVAANLTGCSSEPPTIRTPEPVVMEASAWIESIFQTTPNTGPVMLGCIAIMPPAVFSEDEGMNLFGDGTAE